MLRISAAPGEEVGIILGSTSFYSEQVGQIYDTGSLEGSDGFFEVSSVQIYCGFVVHIGSFREKAVRNVFGEVYPDPARVVSIGQIVDDLIANPENAEWEKYSSELCGGTHISNTREAKPFSFLSEEGIAKGIRRITAVTTEYAIKALVLKEASKTEGSLLEQEDNVQTAKKKMAAENIKEAVKVVTQMAEKACSNGKGFWKR